VELLVEEAAHVVAWKQPVAVGSPGGSSGEELTIFQLRAFQRVDHLRASAFRPEQRPT